MCPRGYGVLRLCNKTSPTLCEPCVAGVNFSQYDDACNSCEKATTCPEDRVLAKPVSSMHQTKCTCKDGYTEEFDSCIQISLPVTTRPVQSSTGHIATDNVTSSQLSGPTGSAAETAKTTLSGTLLITSETKTVSTSTTSISGRYSLRLTDHSQQGGSTSTVYIVIGLCTGLTVAAGVVGIITCQRLCSRNRLTCRDEETLIDQEGGRNGNIQISCVGVRYKLSVPGVCFWMLWRRCGWTKDGIALQSNSCICVQNATITFYDVQPEDAGRYCCKTHNGFGDVKFSVEFVVKGKNQIYCKNKQ
jgi:hypothetical protein